MAKYIDKDTLLAKRERLKDDALQKKGQCKRNGLEKIMHQISAYNKVLSFLDTLEVKEVDLDKEIDLVEDKYHGFESLSRADIIEIIKYFFEVGLKAQKGE